MDHAVETQDPIFVFGPFRLDPARRRLESNGDIVALNARAFDLLVVLVEARDRVLSRVEIMARVWPGVTVDEHNVSVQMSTLRRALGDTGDEPDWIATLPGRGYRFVGSVSVVQPDVAPEAPAAVVEVPAPRARPGLVSRLWNSPAALVLGAIILLVLAGLRLWPASPPAEPVPPRLSIAVMPFRNLTDDGSRPYLADAISDDLTTDLAHIPGSLVIARETADSFKGRNVTVAEIRRALHVRYVLEGSIRAEGAVLHVNAQLIDTETDAHLWSERFDTALSQLDQTRTDIVSRIASALDVQLAEAEGARSARAGAPNPDAFDLFLQARAVIARKSSLENLTQAQKLLERALALQPDYDDALGELSLVLMHKVQSFDDPDDAADFRAWQDVARHALAINPRNLKALVARGRLLDEAGHGSEARSDYAMALQSDPNYVEALRSLAMSAWRSGDLDGVWAPLQRIMSIDPDGPLRRDDFALRGMAETMAGRLVPAREDLTMAIAGDTGSAAMDCSGCRAEFARLFLIAATGEGGNTAGAQALYLAYARGWPNRSVWRIAWYFSESQKHLAGFAPFTEALARAGMPEYIDEKLDFHVPAPTNPVPTGDFDPTPVSLPGGQTIDAKSLHNAMGQRGPLIVDTSAGSAAIPGALLPWASAQAASADEKALFDIEAKVKGDKGAEIVVMGAGVTGFQPYNLALQLINRGYEHVVWFRGGEEAWARAGFKANDAR